MDGLRGRLASLSTLHGGAYRDPSMGEGTGGDGRERRRSRRIHIPLQREAPLRAGEERRDAPDELSIMSLAQRAKASEFWSNLDQNVKEDLYKLNLERSSLRKRKDRGWSKSDVVRLLHHKKEPSLASRWATIMNGRSSRAQLVRQPYSPLLSLQLTLLSLYFHDDEYDHNGDELRL